MDFAEWIREQVTKTYTENGAAARNTTGDARLDLFATIGSLRRADPERIELLFAEAYQPSFNEIAGACSTTLYAAIMVLM